MIIRMEHIGVCANDPKMLTQWYIDKLGFTLVAEKAQSGIFFVGAPGGMMLEVYPQKDGREQAGSNATGGLRHISLEIDDFEDACAQLLAKGVKMDDKIGGDGSFKLRFFEDAEGNLWHLVWRRVRMF